MVESRKHRGGDFRYDLIGDQPQQTVECGRAAAKDRRYDATYAVTASSVDTEITDRRGSMETSAKWQQHASR